LTVAQLVEVPYLRVANVQDGYLDLSEIKTILLPKREIQRYLLHEGDVVLTEGGDFDKLGRGYLWNGQVPNCVHQNHIFAVRCDRRKLLPEFFAYLAQSSYGKSYFLSVAHKTTNLACINATKLRAFPLAIPDVVEQFEIASRLRCVDDALDVQTTKLRWLTATFSQMLDLLITGRVRVGGALDRVSVRLGEVH
jgi:type I restriction enzyme S subunit